MAQCTAKSKQSGQRCKRHAVAGGTVCSIHGGKSPKGVASGTYVHGGYSKHLPKELMLRFEEAVRDPELINLRNETALIEAQIMEMVEKIYAGAGGSSEDVIKAWNTFSKVHMAEKDTTAQLRGLEEAIKALKDDQQARTNLLDLVDQKRRLAEAERKRLVDMRQLVTTEQAMLFATVILEAARKWFGQSDPAALQGFQNDVSRAMNHGAR